LKPLANSTAVREYLISTELYYIAEAESRYNPFPPSVVHGDLLYWVQVDKHDNIVGGRYENYKRMDFMWYLIPQPFSGYFSSLKQLVKEENDDDSFELPTFRDSSIVLRGVEGVIQDNVSVKRYTKTWQINVPKASSIEIRFTKLATVKYEDRVRIYEAENGPLIASVHGNKIPPAIHVKHSQVFIVFSSQGHDNSMFELCYSAM
jgi:hypothetical protein